MTMRTVILNAEVEGQLLSVVLADGVIVEISRETDDPLRVDADVDEIIDASGGALIPGLHDHHVHLLAMAARRSGLDVDRLDSPQAFDDALRHATRDAGEQWVRVGGFDEHRHGSLDRTRLDVLVGTTKVRVQHRSGLAWTLSSAGLDAVLDHDLPEGVERDESGQPSGRLLRLDAWLADQIGVDAPPFGSMGLELAAVGLTGVTDATPNLGIGRMELLRTAALEGSLPQRIVLLGVEDSDLLSAANGADGWAEVGPAKVVIDEMIGLDPDALAEVIAAHHRRGRSVAIHAVSRAETVTTVTAFAIAGTRKGDRLEHGSVLPRDLDPILADGGVTVVVQPRLVHERGDHYLDAVDADDLHVLHRAASLLESGIAVAVGSDAPVTSIDPWATIDVAAHRLTRSGHRLSEAERVDARTALGWYLTDPLDPGGPERRVRLGARADLCLLDAPLAEVLASPHSGHVRMTWLGGRLMHS